MVRGSRVNHFTRAPVLTDAQIVANLLRVELPFSEECRVKNSVVIRHPTTDLVEAFVQWHSTTFRQIRHSAVLPPEPNQALLRCPTKKRASELENKSHWKRPGEVGECGVVGLIRLLSD